MFKIAPIQDPTEQSLVAKECGSEYKVGSFGYVMRDTDSGEVMGFSQFEIGENGGLLLDLRLSENFSEDYEAIFILGRATMNFIDMCGTHTLRATADAGDSTLLRAIGLKPMDDGSYYCDMTGFFDGSHCSGH